MRSVAFFSIHFAGKDIDFLCIFHELPAAARSPVNAMRDDIISDDEESLTHHLRKAAQTSANYFYAASPMGPFADFRCRCSCRCFSRQRAHVVTPQPIAHDDFSQNAYSRSIRMMALRASKYMIAVSGLVSGALGAINHTPRGRLIIYASQFPFVSRQMRAKRLHHSQQNFFAYAFLASVFGFHIAIGR